MSKKLVTNAMRLLNAAKIEYETIEYSADEVGENFGAEIAELTGMPPEQTFKTLAAAGDKTGTVIACVHVCGEVDLKKLAKISGNKRIQMVHVRELPALTGYIRGGVSPIGMKKKYPTYIDKSALDFESVTVSAGVCGASVRLAPRDLQKITDCKFEDIAKGEEV